MNRQTSQPVTTASRLELPPGFKAYYEQHMRSDLERLERQRRKAAVLMGVLLAVAILGALLAIAMVLGKSPLKVAPWVVVMLLVVGAGGALALHLGLNFGRKLRQVLVQPTCQFLGYAFQARPAAFDVRRFATAGIVAPDHKRADLRDHIRGSHNGVSFASCHARLTGRQSRQDAEGTRVQESVTLFEGRLFQYDLPHPVAGTIRIVPGEWLVNLLQSTKRMSAVAGLLQFVAPPSGGGKRVTLDQCVIQQGLPGVCRC